MPLSTIDQAIDMIAPVKFHRVFTAPATDQHGLLKVSYSVAGIDVGEEEGDVPTILFIGGMMGTRYIALSLDWLAKKEGVRVLFLDRPGFGASTEVPLQQRLATFLEIVPLLLGLLNIKHIAIASQSAGTVYALNLLHHHPDLLHPNHPSVALISPWVHQSISSVSLLSLAAMLPDGLIGRLSNTMSFAISNIVPTVSFSGGLLSALASPFKDKTKTQAKKEEDAKKCLEGYGMPQELLDTVQKTVFKYLLAEGVNGVNDEARMCLKSVEGLKWDACENYEEYVKKLSVAWDKKLAEGSKPLRVDIFLPEDDLMIGQKGMKYFEECWKEECGGNGGLKVETTRWKGTDHDSTTSPANGCIGRIFTVAKGLQPLPVDPDMLVAQ